MFDASFYLHYELLYLLSLATLDDSKVARVHFLLGEVSDWDTFFHLISLNSIGLLAYNRLQNLDISNRIQYNPDQFFHHFSLLELRARSDQARAKKQISGLKIILKEMQLQGIEVIVLKGALLGSILYKIPAYKKMNDLDILIRFEQAEAAAVVLKNLGFKSVGKIFGSKEISKDVHHAPPYVNKEFGCIVGLHWGLHSPRCRIKADCEGIWERRQPIQFEGVTAFRMSWEDNLLHLCIHLPFFKTGLRELSDVYNLIRFCKPAVDWDTFATRVDRWNAAESVYRVIKLANSVASFSIPPLLLEAWKKKSSRFCIHDTEARAGSIEILLRSRSTQIGKIEKCFSVFRASENYFEKLKSWIGTWYYTFFPSELEVRKITRCLDKKASWNYLHARLKTPFIILSAMARDHGAGALVYFTIANLGIILKATLTLTFLKNRPTLLERLSLSKDWLEVLE